MSYLTLVSLLPPKAPRTSRKSSRSPLICATAQMPPTGVGLQCELL